MVSLNVPCLCFDLFLPRLSCARCIWETVGIDRVGGAARCSVWETVGIDRVGGTARCSVWECLKVAWREVWVGRDSQEGGDGLFPPFNVLTFCFLFLLVHRIL